MIGVIDSGLGGLDLVRSLAERLPDEDLIYFGDTARTPYGCRSPERITAWAGQSARYVKDRGARILVVASHSIACAALESLKSSLGIPVFDIATSALEAALNRTRSLRIGLVGSTAAVESGRYKSLIEGLDPRVVMTAVACPMLQALVEEGWLQRRETAMIVKHCIRPIKLRQVDTVILGGGYLLPLRRIIQRKLGLRVSLVDGSAELALRVSGFLKTHPMPAAALPKRPRVRLIVSDLTPRVRRSAETLLERPVELESEWSMLS